MPTPQSALELLRQWCSQGGWHDEQSVAFKQVVDTQMLGCMTITAYQKT